jgi:hypothetical protein
MGHKYDKAKSEIKFDSKPKYDTKTKVDDVESKDKDKLKEDIATTTTTTIITTSDNPETIDQTILPITKRCIYKSKCIPYYKSKKKENSH